MAILIPILMIAAVLGAIEMQSFGAFFGILFGGAIISGLVIGLARQAAQDSARNAQIIAQRRQRKHIDTEQLLVSYLTLQKFKLLSDDVDKYINTEINYSTFSNAPFSQDRATRLAKQTTFDDTEEALRWLAAEEFLEAPAAQAIQNEIDARRSTAAKKDATRKLDQHEHMHQETDAAQREQAEREAEFADAIEYARRMIDQRAREEEMREKQSAS